MARIKQAKPVERQPSSEYISHQNSTPKKNNGDVAVRSNGNANKAAPALASSKKDAGVAQLVVAVAGIYGSLYVLRWI